MDSITVTLPPDLEAFVDLQVAEGGYDGADDYVLQLILADAQRQARGQLQNMLHDGLATPEADWTKDEMDRLRATGRAA